MPRPTLRTSPSVTIVEGGTAEAAPSPFGKHLKPSSQNALRGLTTILNGVEGSGKTVAAATADENCPATLPAPHLTFLDNVLYNTIDASALAAFPSLGLEVAQFDLPDFVYSKSGPPDAVAALNIFIQEARLWLKDRPKGVIVTDSLTTLADMLFTTFDDANNTARTYKLISEALRRYYHQLLALDARGIIFIAHLKADQDIVMGRSKEEQEKQLAVKQAIRDAGKLLDDAVIGLDLTPSAMKPFKRGAPMSLNVEVRFNPQLKRRERILNTRKTIEGIEVKNKFEHLLNAQEPANLHALFAKIEEGSKLQPTASVIEA